MWILLFLLLRLVFDEQAVKGGAGQAAIGDIAHGNGKVRADKSIIYAFSWTTLSCLKFKCDCRGELQLISSKGDTIPSY
jgi:hypothetical protein